MRTSPQRRRYSNEGREQHSQSINNHNSNISSYHHKMMKSSLLTLEDEEQPHLRSIMDGEDDYQQQLSKSNSQVVDTIVNAAQICNSLVAEYCGLCTFYIDKQVQYELISNTTANVLPSASLSTFDLHAEYYLGHQNHQHSPRAARDVAEAARMLFDEESVVESVSSR